MNVVTVNQDQAVRFLSSVSKKLRGVLEKPMNESAKTLLAEVKARSVSEFSKPSGELSKSFTWRTRSSKASRGGTIRIDSSRRDALLHEGGGTIRPKKSRTLVVPVSQRAKAWKGRPRNFPGGRLFVPKGKRFLAQKGGAGGGYTVHYVFANTVRVKARKYLTKAVESATPKMSEIFNRALAELHEAAAKEASK